MSWATPQYEMKIVDAAGRALASQLFPLLVDQSLNVINNWRSSHSYPLNTFQITLRSKAKKLERDIIVAQRIKRLESIHAKLTRQKSMRMTQMQDIAGCRVVFKNIKNVRKLVEVYKNSKFGHIFKGEKDYIANPKQDGYRCYHLIYEYVGTTDTEKFNGLKIEIQIRTQLQHAWATAVEAVGIFTKQALKSNQGDEDWRRFFALMGTAVASIEQCAPVPNTPTDKKRLVKEIKKLADKLRVHDMLQFYSATLNVASDAKDAKYFLLSLDLDKKQVTLKRFKASQSQAANEQYTAMESSIPENSSMQVVLVSVESIATLRRAYPNYFLDTNIFADVVKKVLNNEFPESIPVK